MNTDKERLSCFSFPIFLEQKEKRKIQGGQNNLLKDISQGRLFKLNIFKRR